MNKHRGSSFDAFLEEEGILEEVSAKAQKRLFALQLKDTMKAAGINKLSLAKRLETSRSQLDRLLDPGNTSVTLASMERLAHAVGKQLRIELM
ncbi:MAG: XRE family transcriptional regulator [Magnetococcales bacterium]|nr:XRE family transcriptional regulator [Magnetococcales bacterium]MBF0114016.1 XRE family transcriptional regulator [Magnetococcales bacterium]